MCKSPPGGATTHRLWVGGRRKRWKLHTLRAVNWLHLRAEPSSPATLLSQHDHDDVSMLLMTTTHQMTMTYEWLHCMLLYHMPFRRYPTRPACMLTLFLVIADCELHATHQVRNELQPHVNAPKGQFYVGMCARAPRVEVPPTACGWVEGETKR